MNRKVLEVVVDETPSEPPSAGLEGSGSASEVSRVGALAAGESDAPDAEADGDPTLIRSRRDAQELREELERAGLQRSGAQKTESLVQSSLPAQPTEPRSVTEPSALRTIARPSMDGNELSEVGRERGARSWLVLSLSGTAAALALFALLFYAQGGPWPSESVPTDEASSNVSAPKIVSSSLTPERAGLVAPTMRLDLPDRLDEPRGAPVAEAPQLAPTTAIEQAQAVAAPASAVQPVELAAVASEPPAAIVERAEGLLRTDRGPAGARDAKALLEPIMAQQRDNPHAQVALAEACLRLREAACARAAATRAVRLRPKREAYLLLEAKVQAAFPTP